LLDAFARDITAVGHDCWFGELVDFVEEDDSGFAFCDLVTGCQEEALDGGFDVGTDIACLGEGGAVDGCKRDFEDASQGGEDVGFSYAGGAEEEEVGFLDQGAGFVVQILEVLSAEFWRSLVVGWNWTGRVQVDGFDVPWIFIFHRMGIPFSFSQLPSSNLLPSCPLFLFLPSDFSYPLIMVVYRHTSDFLGLVLPNNIFIQMFL
jgi:hypothetical protein